MKILSSEVQQVFRAYAKQLRTDYTKGRNEQVRETRAKGFEKVEISDEARALAANMPELVQKQAPAEKQGKVFSKKENTSEDPEANEKDSDTPKAESGDSRNRRVET